MNQMLYDCVVCLLLFVLLATGIVVFRIRRWSAHSCFTYLFFIFCLFFATDTATCRTGFLSDFLLLLAFFFLFNFRGRVLNSR
uniref:Uncharacterized protein n=1 Tax=Anopheles darlingi TaxID=43151 RepID=A0A2M4DC26_ANODA